MWMNSFNMNTYFYLSIFVVLNRYFDGRWHVNLEITHQNDWLFYVFLFFSRYIFFHLIFYSPAAVLFSIQIN